MSPNQKPPEQKPPEQKPFEQRLRQAAARAEEELHRLVRYLDDEVVPEVRRNSSTALRAAAVRLQKLAESMENPSNSPNSRNPPGQPNPNPPSSRSDSQR